MRRLSLRHLAAGSLLALLIPNGPVTAQAYDPDDPELTAVRIVTRSFAMALGNSTIREQLKQTMDTSSYRENKISFTKFLITDPQRLALRAMAQAAQLDTVAIQTFHYTVRPMETYLPVPAHRAAWGGGTNLIVASSLEEDMPLVAYDLAGNEVSLSLSTPPSTPVLILAPVETDFNRAPVMPSPPPPSNGTNDPFAQEVPSSNGFPGMYLTVMNLNNLGEAWFKGEPEIEVHVLGTDPLNPDRMKSFVCMNEYGRGPAHFNMNSGSFSGAALFWDAASMDRYLNGQPGQPFHIIIIEDDDTPCQLKADPDLIRARTEQIAAMGVAQVGLASTRQTNDRGMCTSLPIYCLTFTVPPFTAYTPNVSFWVKTKDEVLGHVALPSDGSTLKRLASLGSAYEFVGAVMFGNVQRGALRIQMRN